MCGIVGYWNIRNGVNAENEILHKMAKTIAHRGPDDEGYYINEYGLGLAHKRLSIIDLTAQGHQPMVSHDRRFVMVFNGEIYNYIELAEQLSKEGVQFKGHSDSEVLLECYRQYGESCLTMFNGMFAFVIWDNEKKEIFAARDRVGIKPLYYYYNQELFAFGSEIKAVIAHPNIPVKPNPIGINSYLTLSHQVDNQTWYADVLLLEPGHQLTIKANNLEKKCYWKPEVAIDYSRSYDSFKEELTGKIYDAIKLHQRSDLPIGAHLSGGIDSSAIVAIASKMSTLGFHTFSSAFEGLGKQFDENKEIQEVQKKFNTIHHQISANPLKVMEVLPDLISYLDEPVAGPAIIPMYFVNELINQHGIRVVNGGQGVDELFGGYRPSYTLAARNLLSLMKSGQKVPLSEVARIPGYLHKGGTFKRLYNRASPAAYSIFRNAKASEEVYGRYYEVVKGLGAGMLGFEQNMLMSLKFYLPALLHQEDRMSMKWSIESRVPFLDHRLVDFSMTIPSYYKVKAGTLKSIFRESLRGIVPDMILNNKIKRGYPTPISVWSKKEMAQFFRNNLQKDNSIINEYINMDDIQLMLNDHMSGKSDYTIPLWSVLCTKIWFNKNFG
ncbi:asparagine synthase (glutamine-hydrolyzing) [Pedobacter gandavensis]|uniref:asparagine synthase (glutamine-hydrolyzing) n=1 Tax=Pedobacter gandavensis TaxID=2679963 RepID=UPI0029310B92|nr:asparagine synthase (glutamine-hydrolyzing) [Pedobacter gandavensis]